MYARVHACMYDNRSIYMYVYIMLVPMHAYTYVCMFVCMCDTLTMPKYGPEFSTHVEANQAIMLECNEH